MARLTARRVADAKALLGRLIDRTRIATTRAVVARYGAAPGGLLASGLAFTAFFAAVPTTLLILAVAGTLASDPAFEERLIELLASAFPPLRDMLVGALDAVSEGTRVSSIGGLIGLVWATSRFYQSLATAVGRIFHDVPQRGLARRTIYGFVWVLSLVGIVVSLVVLAAIAGLVDSVAPASNPFAGAVSAFMGSPFAMLGVAGAILALLYRVLPPKPPTWRSIASPAVGVAVIIVVLSQAFALLAPYLVRSSSVAGSLAAAFAALVWLSFVFQALLLGAAWVSVRDDRIEE